MWTLYISFASLCVRHPQMLAAIAET
ncbi:hypothetical protein CBM2587_B60061 [Cupriavidus taiwanensis]|uniref:Uncharacterized protein n=1 Tax=Cupriavidus taiwanensis TaxID=164546 RepID=A0A375C5H0_9BURK|nr:hypothetical protein CBM2587_B60061 [Cupriavidus taiwanensis]